ncbi:hypothetical protein AOLI_G00155560 [Acnodon oligacanthus]
MQVVEMPALSLPLSSSLFKVNACVWVLYHGNKGRGTSRRKQAANHSVVSLPTRETEKWRNRKKRVPTAWSSYFEGGMRPKAQTSSIMRLVG